MTLTVTPPDTDRPLRFELPEIEQIEQLPTLVDAAEPMFWDLSRAALPVTKSHLPGTSKAQQALAVFEHHLHAWQRVTPPVAPVPPPARTSGSQRRKYVAADSRYRKQLAAQVSQVNLDVSQVNDYLAALEVALQKAGPPPGETPNTKVTPKRVLRWF